MGAFIRKLNPEEIDKPEYLYAKFDEEWTFVEKFGLSENMRLVKETGGDLTRPVCFGSS